MGAFIPFTLRVSARVAPSSMLICTCTTIAAVRRCRRRRRRRCCCYVCCLVTVRDRGGPSRMQDRPLCSCTCVCVCVCVAAAGASSDSSTPTKAEALNGTMVDGMMVGGGVGGGGIDSVAAMSSDDSMRFGSTPEKLCEQQQQQHDGRSCLPACLPAHLWCPSVLSVCRPCNC